MELLSLQKLLGENTYPGRGIVLGKSDDGKKAVIAYFIMGRSENSRNRVFTECDGGIITEAHDPSKMTDPTLIIYAPVRVLENLTIVTNGDQTDTIFDIMDDGGYFEEALRTRTFEPDAPNWTPRISGLVDMGEDDFSMQMSILKSADGNGDYCQRYFFDYPSLPAGEGRFIHTYKCDGNPIPSFEGEPERVAISGSIDEFTSMLWENLNPDNKVSLFVRTINIADNSIETRIINKHRP